MRTTYFIILYGLSIIYLFSSPIHADMLYWASEYEALTAEKNTLTQDLQTAQTANEELSAKFKKLEQNYEQLQLRLQRTEQALSVKTEEMNALFYELEESGEELDAQAARMKETMREELQSRDAKIKELQQELTHYKQSVHAMSAAVSKRQTDVASRSIAAHADVPTFHVRDKLHFPSGTYKITKQMIPVLNEIAAVIAKQSDKMVLIQGHTDSKRVVKKRYYRDNWQLSTERALAIMGYLIQKKKIDPARFVALGYGQYKPVAPNDNAKNRTLNRRVDILVTPAPR